MKKLLSIICCLAIILSLAACGGGGDAIKGTWAQENTDWGTVTFKFDGKGNYTSESDFFENKGTYTIDGSKVTIVKDGADSEPVEYDFTVSDKSLTLTAGPNSLAPDYNLTKK